MEHDHRQHTEELVEKLNDDKLLEEYKRPYDNYRPSALPRLLGHLLVFCGNTVYGKEPSYLKFRAVEVIARVPYHSWASAAYTLLTLFYADEARALRLSKIAAFSRIAQDNETMHVVIISQLSKNDPRKSALTHTFIPLCFAFFYYWASYLLYMVNPRYSLELNYLFEQHAFDQYSRFITRNEEALRNKVVMSDFLTWYGRAVHNEYELFRSIRNDELIHRNRSIREIELHANHARA